MAQKPGRGTGDPRYPCLVSEFTLRAPPASGVSPSIRLGRGALELFARRRLITRFARRELLAQSRGSALGWLWELLNPLATVLVFTFVFSVVLQVRWEAAGLAGDTSAFVLMMLAALVPFTIFSDTLARAPTLLTKQPTLVTKVVFPIEILPVSTMLVALVPGAVLAGSVVILHAATSRTISPTIGLFPLAILPTLLFTLGFAWLVAALGVFLRDIGQLVQIVVGRLLFFLTPIFYPASAVPAPFNIVLQVNPLTYFVEDARRTLVLGEAIHWPAYAVLLPLSVVVAALGHAVFIKGKRSYADVL